MTERRDAAGDDDGAEPSADAAPSETPSEPPPIGWATGVQWEPAPEGPRVLPPAGVKLAVGSVIGRTLDMFIRRGPFFVVLALPSAVIAIVSTIILSGSTSSVFTLFVSLGSLAVAVIFTMAMIAAADDLRAGRIPTYGLVIRRAADRVGSAFLATLAQLAALVGLTLVAGLVIAFFLIGGNIGGQVIAALVAIAAIALLLAVAVRWSLLLAAIVLDRFGPLKGLSRSRAVTRGNAWRVFAVFAVFGVLFLPLSVGVFGLSLVPRTPVVLVLTIASGLLSGTLTAIATSITYGDLTGRPAVEAGRDTRRNASSILVAAILVVGAIALVLGGPNIGPGLSRLSPGFVPAEDRGKIFAGTTRNPFDPCKPSDAGSTFSTTDTLYVGGYFTKAIPAGQSATVDVYANGTKVNSAPLTDPSRPIACYAERDPLVGAAPGTYRLVVSYGGETIGEGTFTIH
jgi:MFS family permease